MATIDKEFQTLCKKIMTEGKEYENKNRGVKRLQIPSYTFRHEFKDGFPAITNKKLYWKGIVGELIWFLRGDNDVKFLNENGIKIWNKDAYNWYKKSWTDVGEGLPEGAKLMSFEEFEKIGKGSVGQNYSVQWRNFNGTTDQIKELIDTMRKDIMSSRLKVNAWNPCEVDMTALPPCHSEFQIIGVPLKNDKCVAREGWNGKNMFLWLNKGNKDRTENHPDAMEAHLTEGIQSRLFQNGDKGTVTRLPNINMQAATGSVVAGWLASQTDMLAEDWCIVGLEGEKAANNGTIGN